jgi:uncharacterized protein (DUF302 family)
MMRSNGLTILASQFDPRETMDRLQTEIESKGLSVFARIDHAAGAAAAGLTLPPTELLIFGNAKGGTPLMQVDQTIGIDLPLKALVYRDPAGKVWLAYNDPGWLAARHGLGSSVAATVSAMTEMLRAIAASATRSC